MADIESEKFTIKGLLEATENGNRFEVEEHLQNGVDVNGKDEDGNTALHIACTRGTLFVVSILLEGGADVLAVNRAGDTPLEIAESNGSYRLLRLLQSYQYRQKVSK